MASTRRMEGGSIDRPRPGRRERRPAGPRHAGKREFPSWQIPVAVGAVVLLVVAVVAVVACTANQPSPPSSPTAAAVLTTASRPAEPKPVSPTAPAAPAVNGPRSPAVWPVAPPQAVKPAVYVPAAASDLGKPAMPGQVPPGEGDTQMCGTAIEFVSSPAAAAQLAQQRGRLQFSLHVSGHFEDSAFT